MLFQFPLFGVPVSVHWSTIFLILVFCLDGYVYAKTKQKDRGVAQYLVTGLVCAILIIISVFVHELSHAVVANALGFHITKAGVNGLFAFVSNDYDIRTISPLSEALIVIAGPASNFLLALIGVPIIYLIGNSLPETIARYFSFMNVRLGRINLWPIFILDGAKILDAGVRATIGGFAWAKYIPVVVSALFFAYLFSKKKGHFEIEDLIDKIP